LGIDITRYDGHSFHGPTRDAFNGLLVLVRNLPAGIFEVGLPRVPREDWHDFERYQRLRVAGQLIYNRSDDFPKFSGHFRAPGPLMTRLPSVAWTGPNEFLNADLELRRSPSGGRGLSHDLRYFNHAANASLLRRAADESEGTIRLLFPDEPNHVHLTVDIGGAWTEVLDANRRARRAR
jgi:hypothetical protein